MSQKIPSAEGLITKLHGKGSMSEVLRIERQRLMEQAAEEMRSQLGVVAPVKPALPEPPTDTYQPTSPHVAGRWEGLSKLSRFVGEDLSEFDGTITHSEQTITASPEWSTDTYYLDVAKALPFSSERDLLNTLCRLTIGWGSFRCRITLGLLSSASRIRNAKTLRKWLSDLHRRSLIRYIPVHGDLRGSIIELTPPEEVRNAVERSWRTNRLKA